MNVFDECDVLTSAVPSAKCFDCLRNTHTHKLMPQVRLPL